jgi:hypothetical protein
MIEPDGMTVTLFANHWKLMRGKPLAARVAFHLKPERGRYGEESQEEKSCEEEKEVMSLHRPGRRLPPGRMLFRVAQALR